MDWVLADYILSRDLIGDDRPPQDWNPSGNEADCDKCLNRMADLGWIFIREFAADDKSEYNCQFAARQNQWKPRGHGKTKEQARVAGMLAAYDCLKDGEVIDNEIPTAKTVQKQ